MEFEAVDEGKIGKILVPEGTEGVKVNQPIAVLLGEGEKPGNGSDIPAAMQSIKEAVSAETPSPKKAPLNPRLRRERGARQKSEAPKPAPQHRPPTEQRVFASPLAKRLAAQAGIDIAAVQGSGPRGRIVKADVEDARSRA